MCVIELCRPEMYALRFFMLYNVSKFAQASRSMLWLRHTMYPKIGLGMLCALTVREID